MAGGAHFRKWRGKEVSLAVRNNMAKALGKFGLVAEGFSKKELYKGHGVITGTLRRSIHTAQPGYNWTGDNIGASELGGAATDGLVAGNRVTLEVGSGLIYALAVHQGHDNFAGYHYLVNGVDKAKPQMPGILKKYELK